MNFKAARAGLIKHLATEISNDQVLETMSRVPRERFIPPEERHLAYEDRPLPIGLGQTISQPYIIALMTASLGLTGKEKVLEIGCGSGYQAAILAELARLVITIERLPALAEKARRVFNSLSYKNIKVYLAEPTLGRPVEAPYDAIIVTAGAPKVPDVLLEQLIIGGRLVVPVGSRYEQELYKIIKYKDKNLIHNLGGCRFVPLIGEGAWEQSE